MNVIQEKDRYHKGEIMGKVILGMLAVIAALQLIMMIEFIDLQGRVAKTIEMNENAAFNKMEASALELKNERMRQTYLRVILDAQGLPEEK